MANKIDTTFYVHHAGNVGGEPVAHSWDEIVAMCRSGQLHPASLIFFEDENQWKKATDTELAVLLDNPQVDSVPDESEAQTELQSQYEQLKREIEGSEGDWNKIVQLAEMAATLGDRRAALRHFQEALNGHRYHGPIVNKVKRCLSREEWESLRYVSRPEPVWSAPLNLVGYPLARGPFYLAIPTIVFTALFWFPGVALVGAILLYLWATEVIRVAAAGQSKPPLWHGALSDPVNTVLKPLGVGLIICIELYLPFILVATMIAAVGDELWAWTVIQKSPIMIVLMSTISLLYIPGVLVIAGSSDGDVKRIANPREVFSVIIKMEREYVASVGIIAALIATWGIFSYLFMLVPFAGRVVAVAMGLYVLIVGGLVVGRLQSRFSEELS